MWVNTDLTVTKVQIMRVSMIFNNLVVVKNVQRIDSDVWMIYNINNFFKYVPMILVFWCFLIFIALRSFKYIIIFKDVRSYRYFLIFEDLENFRWFVIFECYLIFFLLLKHIIPYYCHIVILIIITFFFNPSINVYSFLARLRMELMELY